MSLAERWRGRPLEETPGSDLIVAALFVRSLNTYVAAVRLCEAGYGEQAAMLNRSLFEDMADAHWTVGEPALAVSLLADHGSHGAMLLADAARKYPDFFPAAEIPEYDAAERTRLDGLFGPHGTKSWTRLNIHERVERIAHHWTDIGAETQPLFLYRDIAQRENNQTLHVSAVALGSTVRERNDQFVTFRLGPDVDMLDRALFGAFWIFSQTVGLLLDHFSFKVDKAERVAATDMADFKRPSAGAEPGDPGPL